jgi:cytochrome P450
MAFSKGTVLLALTTALLSYIICSSIYNLFFHPLRKYPGPLLWRASAIPKRLIILAGLRGSKATELHNKYGEIVRIAPNELSYISAQAWRDIFGRPGKHEMKKDPRYFGKEVNGAWSVASAPHADHTRQRRLLALPFTNTALRNQVPMLVEYADKMVSKIGETAARDGKVNLVDFISFTTFDIMAELAFGESLHMLDRTDYVPWVRTIFSGLKFIVFRAEVLQVPILGPVIQFLTSSTLERKSKEHMQFAADLVDRQLDSPKDEKRDLWNQVLQSSEDGKGLTRGEMHVNAATLMVAGTETTATNMSGVFYYLCQSPRVRDKLVQEIRSSFKSSDDMTPGALAELKYLNLVLRENLRIYIPGGGGMTRVVPPEGAQICGDFIPGGTLVEMNQYAAYRYPSHFSQPLDFIPERWLDSEDEEGEEKRHGDADGDFTTDRKDVFEPFSFGPRACIGQNLAWLELRLLVAKTLWHYDIELCPESENWTDQKSYLAWEKGPLMVTATPAKR